MAANDRGINGPRMGRTTGRLRRTLTNRATKQSGGEGALDRRRMTLTGRQTSGGGLSPGAAPGTTGDLDQALSRLKEARRGNVRGTPSSSPLTMAPSVNMTGLTAMNTVAQAGATNASLFAAMAAQAKSDGKPATFNNAMQRLGAGYHASPQQAEAMLRRMLQRRGFGAGAFRKADYIIDRESGYKYNADNPTSTAFGIPQAMQSVHGETRSRFWMNNARPQLRWFVNYVLDRYGSFASAVKHKKETGWY